MPQIEPNFTEVKKVVPGTYHARVVDSKVIETKKGGAFFVKWSLEIFGSEDQTVNGQRVFHNTMTSGPGAFGLEKLAEVCLGKGEVPTGSWDTEILHDRNLDMVIAQQKDNEAYMEVKSVSTYTGE